MSKKEKIFTFRMEAELLDKLKESAERHKRSMAKEIEYILEDYFLVGKELVDLSPEMNKILNLFLEQIKKENIS